MSGSEGRFPKSLIEFQGRFASESACAEYLFERRWPEGFVCPGCGDGRCGEFACLMVERPAPIAREETNGTKVTGFGRTARHGVCVAMRRRRCPDGRAGPRGGHHAEIVGAAGQ